MNRLLAAIWITPVLIGCSTNELNGCVIPGTYTSVSEAEWEVIIEIEPNGSGFVQRSDWIAGRDPEGIERAAASWRCVGPRELEISYRGGRERLRFDALLSMAEFGYESESAPGLTRVGPRPADSILAGTHFWEREAVRRVAQGPRRD